MNGRLYDAKLHRFLQPDNYVQDPYNTQNYNRYGYVLNNPLKYTDPSGEELVTAIVIAVTVAITSYTLTAMYADVPFTAGGLAKAAVMGAISGAVTFGIGEWVKGLFTTWVSCSAQQVARLTVQALAHGTFQGGVTAAQGGKFKNGFAAGAISSLAASAFAFDGNTMDDTTLGWANSVRSSGTGMIAFGTISGGAGAALTGGNFWQGAVTGLIVSGLNHAMDHSRKHKFDREIDEAFGKNADSRVFDPSDEKIKTIINKVGTLRRLYQKFIAKYKNLQINYMDTMPSDGSDGKTFFNLETKNVESVSIYRGATETYRYFAKVLLHEFGHVSSGYYGYIFNNYKQYGKYSDIPIALDEVYAHKFAYYHGGVSYNTPYYNKFANFLMDNTRVKINPDTLKLPHF